MKNVDFFVAKKRLTVLWVVLGSVLFACFIFQLIGTRYDHIQDKAIGWFIPNLFPMLLLVVSGLYGDLKKRETTTLVPLVFFNLACYLSIAYFVIFFSIFFTYTRQKGYIIDYYMQWNLLLGPVQALVSASIGAFFAKQKQPKDTSSTKNEQTAG